MTITEPSPTRAWSIPGWVAVEHAAKLDEVAASGALVGLMFRRDPGAVVRGPRVTVPAPALSPRMLDVLRGMAAGKSNEGIAAELELSVDTVKTHARKLFRVLGATDRAHAVALGFRCGVIR